MDARIRTILATLGISAALAGGAALIRDALPPQDMTYDEYIAYVAMVNHEIQQSRGKKMILENIHGQRDFLRELDARIKQREVTEGEVVLDGETLSGREYKELRKELIGRRK